MQLRSLMPFGFGGVPQTGGRNDPFLQFRREVDRVFDDFFQRAGAAPAAGEGLAAPRLDVCETEEALQVCAELPGVSDKDLDVQLNGDVLTIRGEKKLDREDKSKDWHLVERSYGSFARSLRLPYRVDEDKVEASFKDGVLTVTLPKPEETRRNARRIEIKNGGDAAGSASGET